MLSSNTWPRTVARSPTRNAIGTHLSSKIIRLATANRNRPRIADLVSFTLTFTDDDELNIRLKDRASANGRTVDRETVEILSHALGAETKHKSELVRKIRAIVDPIGGIELDLPPRGKAFATGERSADFSR